MYLKALEIQGFKSFPDKTILTFGEDITAIVGPNGSGKSNLSDAIRWVMGEQSTRALRGGKMEDVIFGGTERRKQLGFAEVSLVLDNADHSLSVPEDEVMVTRRYYRSGESEYYINRRTVRLRDVNELFMDTGLGREGYSIIGQGKIDEILSVKSADRRDVFEEAAGISRFRHRKEEAERKLERTEENLVRIRDKIDELELQVVPLRNQAEKAKRFLILRDELRALEISLWLEQLDRVRAAAIKTNSDCEQARYQKEETQKELDALYATVETLGGQMREKDLQAEKIRFLMMQKQADANELESAIAVRKSNIQNNLENADRIRRELDQQEGRAGSIAAQIEERQARLTAILAEGKTLSEGLASKQEEANQIAQSAGCLAEQLEDLRRRENVDNASATQARALLSALAAAAQELMDRDAALRRELAEGEETLRTLEEQYSVADASLRQAREDRDALQNMIHGYTLRVQTREKRAGEAEERYRTLQMEENALKSRIHMLTELEKTYEGYHKAVKLVMGEAGRGQLHGVRGPVAGLIRVPDSYAVAIEIALGGAMQNIVVEREEDGKKAIQWLKRREGGRATFLPMNAIQPAEFRERGVEQEQGFVGMGDQLISFEGEYARICASLLGRTVIAEDMDAAIAMARKYGRRFKIVTLDGQVLNPGGSMTGGSVSHSAGILSRANELDRLHTQAETFSQSLAETARVRAETGREAVAARYELETAQGQVRQHEDAILKWEERCASYETRIREGRELQAGRSGELEQLMARAAQTESDTIRARQRIEELEGSAAALRAEAQGKEQGQNVFRDKAQAISETIAQTKMRFAALEAERQATEKTLGELETMHRDLSGDREERATLLLEFERKNSVLKTEIVEQEQALENIRQENRDHQAAIVRLNEEKLTLEAQRNRVDRESREKNETLLRLEREVSVLEQKRNNAALEEKNLLDKLWETYELTHQAAQAQRVALESTAQVQRRTAELKKAISALGNINLDAIEEFQRVNERYTYLTDQRDDVEQAKKELSGIIADITAEMKRIFTTQFALLNETFGQTFRELFGGGKATLELEDENQVLDCGIEIRVQPPGKALKVLSLLSGGEKAFVAIALYFAILKVRPTPFCVMDEIEAALDDANVIRFARYLRGMAENTQFIVITHRRGTMEEADVLYGVTMQEHGISRMLTINLNDVEKELTLQ